MAHKRELRNKVVGSFGRVTLLLLPLLFMVFPEAPSIAQTRSPSSAGQQSTGVVEGAVRNGAGDVVAGASLVLQRTGSPSVFKATSNAEGGFAFFSLPPGVYSLSAEKSGAGKILIEALSLSAGEKKRVSVVLRAEEDSADSARPASKAKDASEMQFADEPGFTVAGVTDWTNVGLHSSATDARTSEALARDTRALETAGSGVDSREVPGASSSNAINQETENKLRAALAQSPASFQANHELGAFYCHAGRYAEAIPLLRTAFQLDSRDLVNNYELALAYLGKGDLEQARKQRKALSAATNSAEAHRFGGDLDERLNDPLSAVREYQEAARLDPSEQNYFEWGTDLLLHRAAQPALEVFSNGLRAHPHSARMLMGLGTALFGTGDYVEAAQRFCEASDLKPADSTPYFFLGKIEQAAPEFLPCGEEKLARFANDQPANVRANYYYGLTLAKKAKGTGDKATLDQARAFLEKAVQQDPKVDDGYLQLGIVYEGRGDFPKAISAYQKATEVNPRSAEAHYRLAVAYRRNGDAGRAAEQMQIYQQIGKMEAAAREREERELQQFLIIMKGQPAASTPH